MTFGLTYPQLKALSPCEKEFKAVSKALGGARKWNGNLVTADMARDAGVSFENIVWVASRVAGTDKEVARRVRHFGADCAAHVLYIFEDKYPKDDRPRKAIQAARDYADGKIDDAAGDAAGDAARLAARLAAWDAAGGAAAAARLAAGDAAAAAGDAAGDAARLAAWDAAGVAARLAAGGAAGVAAWVAARLAAGAAARLAAGAAAGDAEHAWQFDRLIAWLSDDAPEPFPVPEKMENAQ